MFRRLLSVGIVGVLAVVMLGAGNSADPGARYGRLGHNMMCVCSCGQVLLECNHVGCPDSKRMIGELQDQVNAAGPGVSGGGGTAGIDKQILDWFVAKYGATVLASPSRGGFDTVAWIVPIAGFLLAIFGTALLVKMWSRKKSPGIPIVATVGVNDALRARIRRETEF